MAKIEKRTKTSVKSTMKSTVQKGTSTDTEKSIWCYDQIDRNGSFAFDLSRTEFKHKEYLEKMINYATMTWTEIKKQTHDDGKSKHHFIPFDKMSKDARTRFAELPNLVEREDSIFSFALDNRTRIIGIRENQFFHVVWYDANHEVYPVSKKHT